MRHSTYLSGENFVELTSTKFRKQVLRKGVWVHPNDPQRRMVIDDTVLASMVQNFNRGVIDKVPVPWTHTDDARANTGYVVGLEKTEDGLNALLEFSDEEAARKASKNEIPGVSVGLDFDYEVKDTSVPEVGGKRIGPTLLHVALINHPYIKGMKDFEPVALSEGGGSEPLILEDGEERDPVTKEELMASLKEQGIDVEALLSEVDSLKANLAKVQPVAEVVNAIRDKLSGIWLSEGQDLVEAVGVVVTQANTAKGIVDVLGEGKVSLSEGGPVETVKGLITEVTSLKAEKAQVEADKAVGVLLSEGKILPAQKDKFTKLFLSDKGMFEELTADMPKVVDLSEKGTAPDTKPGEDVSDEAEVERLTAGYKKKDD